MWTVSIGSGNDLVQNGQEEGTWTNNDPVHYICMNALRSLLTIIAWQTNVHGFVKKVI